jgi:hypothetical protein
LELAKDDVLAPQFGMIESIVKTNNRVIFCCEGLNYFVFDSTKFYAHKVSLGKTRFSIDFSGISNKIPFVINLVGHEHFINTE